ncbi:carbohydrate porin [Cerasicoccus fimbriatus]|uniref:carbohydrate porin n=1 Tax=Cerasicoccus fimbriatus TaxID=3014554 RepID=UPI0022B54DC5|nr:carbohydrate porin [Cerasicoccus sp. TK19100]
MKKHLIPMACLATFVGSAAADDQDFFTRDHMLGDWYGVRTDLEDEGVSFDFNNTFDYYDDIAGALASGGTYFGRARATINLDLDKLVGLPNAKVSVGGVSQYGKNYNRSRFGVLTNPSSIEGVDTTRFANIWFEQSLFDNFVTYRVGKVDGVGNFGAQPYGGTFMNDELVYIPNLLFAAGLPFDPAQQLGAVVTLRPFEDTDAAGLYFKGGVFNSNNLNAIIFDDIGTDFTWDGPVAIAGEVGYDFGDEYPGYAKAGLHHNFGTFDEVNSANRSRGNTLFYANVGQTIWNLNDSGERHVDASFSLNYAPKEEVNVYHFETTAMIRAIGPFEARPIDEAGVGLIAAWLSDDYSNSLAAPGYDSSGNEFTVEVTYKARVTPWFTVQPDFQVVVNPNGNAARDPVYLVGVRNVIDF